MSTVHPQIAPRHETTCITHQEGRRSAVLLRPTQPPQHILRRPLLLPLRKLLEQRFHHRRHDVAGRDAVHANGVRSPLRGEVARELDDGRFGGVVGWAVQSLLPVSRIQTKEIRLSIGREINGEREKRDATHSIRHASTHTSNHCNAAPVPKPDHLPRRRLRRHEAPRHVDAHHQIAVARCVLQRRRLLLDAGCGDQTVQAAMLGGDLLDDGVQSLNLPDIDAAVVQRCA